MVLGEGRVVVFCSCCAFVGGGDGDDGSGGVVVAVGLPAVLILCRFRPPSINRHHLPYLARGSPWSPDKKHTFICHLLRVTCSALCFSFVASYNEARKNSSDNHNVRLLYVYCQYILHCLYCWINKYI